VAVSKKKKYRIYLTPESVEGLRQEWLAEGQEFPNFPRHLWERYQVRYFMYLHGFPAVYRQFGIEGDEFYYVTCSNEQKAVEFKLKWL
jgi:hypothetical protein